jgi:hypothetical protein
LIKLITWDSNPELKDGEQTATVGVAGIVVAVRIAVAEGGMVVGGRIDGVNEGVDIRVKVLLGGNDVLVVVHVAEGK